MPAANVTAIAQFTEKLYTLKVKGGTVKNNDNGETSEDGKVYKFAYNTEITVVANPDTLDKMFVGWDYQVKNNRVGELGNREYGPFEMPDETLTVWANFSTKSSIGMANPSAYNNTAKGAKKITDGIPNGEPGADPDLQGMSGYRFAIPANTVAYSDYTVENIPGSNISNLYNGSQTIKLIFKNHHDTLPVTVELFINAYNAIAASGYVTVPAGQVVTKTFTVPLGYHNSWLGFAVRANIGGSTGYVLLDMVAEKADTYPEGDRQFEVFGRPQYVTLAESGADGCDTYTSGGPDTLKWGNQRYVNNALGLSMIMVYAQNLGLNGYIRALVNNMPDYNPEAPVTRVYFRIISLTNNPFAFTVNFGTAQDPTMGNGSSLGSKTITLGVKSIEIFAVDITRADNEQIYFSLIKHVIDSSGLTGYNFIVQMSYNNVFGYNEA